MLWKTSEQVRACLERAFDAKRKADLTADPVWKADFLEMEKRWLALARSYEFTERLTDFAAANSEWRRTFNERLRAGERSDDAPRLQKIIREGNVDALLEHMWLASIVESSGDAIISKNLDGIITSWNKGAERIFGYLAEEAIGRPVTILIPLERRHEEDVILGRIRRGHRVEHYETVRQRKNGSLLDISLTVSPIKGAEGQVVGASKIARDISDRKRSEAQISKNLLANVQAIVQLSYSSTPNRLKEAIKGRIEALADVYSRFAQSRWAGAELGYLVRRELSPYALDGKMRTRIDGPTAVLKPDMAQAIAVALRELATNAAKYGALSVAEGRVGVEWSHAADGRLVLRWIETGGPPINPPTRKGFGTTMMETMIRDRVNGEVRLDWRAEGLVCEIVVPR